MNEEEIKIKLLLPYLQELGFDPSELSLETSFTIRLGKHQHKIQGRLDILCKRNDKNLFLLELKSDEVSITQKDINQGISYARALDQIAPFTIVSNGKITRIFDTVSKMELTGKNIATGSDYWRHGCTLSTDVELAVRYEALQKFVSLSEENLQIFCKHQVQDRMGAIIGNIDAPSAKFVKELYIQRADLQDRFKEFMDSPASAFGIVGRAGVGKTNAICSLALQSLSEHLVFFYNAAIISRSPVALIAQDLNLVFSSKSDSDTVLKKLDEFGRFTNKKIILFIDAIDESLSQEIALDLSEIALAIKHLNYIKLCISCKDNIWLGIIRPNDNATHLYEELAKFDSVIPAFNHSPGHLLDDFSDEELRRVIPVYKKVFDFKGDISDQLLNELRNGLFLRIFSEVYSGKPVPGKIDDRQLISAYLTQSLKKTGIGVQAGLRILSQIGKILFDYQYSDREAHEDAGLAVETLLDTLNFALDQSIPEDLFARNILTKSNKEDTYHISFYYSKIRDYIICYHTFKLNKLNDGQFANVIEGFYDNYIGQSAIAFYTENASYHHRQVLTAYKQNKALSFVNQYQAYLEAYFSNFKSLFRPKTTGDIGIVLPTDILKNDGYALYPMPQGSGDKIIYEDLRNAFAGDYYRSRMCETGVETVYGSHNSLLKRDQSTVIQQNIFEQLKDIIEKGKLNPYVSDILLLEQIALVIYYYRKELQLDPKLVDFNLPRFELIYPINLQDIQHRIKRFLLTRYFQDKNFPRTELSVAVEQALNNQLEIPKLNIGGDFPPLEIIGDMITALRERGYEVIQQHHLPYPDKTVEETRQFCHQNNIRDISEMRTYQFSPDQAKLYIESFFSNVEEAYKTFVEHLFPTFKDQFPFYQTMPHTYHFYLKDNDVLKWGSYGYLPSPNGKLEFHFSQPKTSEQANKEDGIQVLRGFSLDKLLRRDYYTRIKTFERLNTSKVDDFCMIRNWIYKLLKDDMREIFKERDIRI